MTAATTSSCSGPVTRPRTRPGPLARELAEITESLHRYQHRLVHAAAEFADSTEWVAHGSPTPAHWLADLADVEVCTAREWVRIGRALRRLPHTRHAFETAEVSYTKVRALTRVADPDSEHELLELARRVPAGRLGTELARWLATTSDPDTLARHQRATRSLRWRTEPDGTVTFTLQLPPQHAAELTTLLTTTVMRTRIRPEPDGTMPTLAHQHADALVELLHDDRDRITTEVIFHVRGDGCTADDGTPVTSTAIAELIDDAALRVMIHDSHGNPVDVSNRRRHPTTRQKRIVHERDRTCTDCGATRLLHYDHVPDHTITGHTLTTELELRCAPCHRRRHQHETETR